MLLLPAPVYAAAVHTLACAMPIYSFQLLSEMGVGCGVAWTVCSSCTHSAYMPISHIRMPIYACAMRMPIFRLYACPYCMYLCGVHVHTSVVARQPAVAHTHGTIRTSHRTHGPVYNSNINVFV